MRYMTLVKATETSGPPPKELMDAINKLGEEAMKVGAMVETGGLLPTTTGARIRLAGGKLTVTDGPFTEAKEVVGGYAVFEVKSKEEIMQWATRFMQLHKEHWKGWEGETEIREMWVNPAFTHEAAHR
jgi:hypothetical protein